MAPSAPPATTAQRRALDLLYHYSFAVQAQKAEKPFWTHGHKIPWNIVNKLMDQGLVKRVTVVQGEKFPDGRVNQTKNIFFVICLTKKGKAIFND